MINRFALAVIIVPMIGHAPLAADATIGGVLLKLPPPQGYCELSESNPADARRLRAIGDIVKKGGNQLLAIVSDCQQLAASRSDARQLVDDYVQYLTPIDLANEIMPPDAIKQICHSERTQGAKDDPALMAEVKKYYEEAAKNVQLRDLQSLGVLDEDSTACYTGLLSKLKTTIGTEKIQLGVLATIRVKTKLVFYNRFAVFKDADAMAAVLRGHKANVAAFLAANK
jgi:hypothetical protein